MHTGQAYASHSDKCDPLAEWVTIGHPYGIGERISYNVPNPRYMDNLIDGGDIPTMKKCVVCIQNKTEQVGEVLDLALTLIDESIMVMCCCEGCFDAMVWDESIVMAVVE